MCRSIAMGGRRCLFHSPAGYIARKITEVVSGVEKEDIAAIFSLLRAEGAQATKPISGEFEQWLTEQSVLCEGLDLDKRVKKTLQAKFSKALLDVNDIDGSSFYALRNLTRRSVLTQSVMLSHLIKISLQLEMTLGDTSNLFNSLKESQPKGSVYNVYNYNIESEAIEKGFITTLENFIALKKYID